MRCSLHGFTVEALQLLERHVALFQVGIETMQCCSFSVLIQHLPVATVAWWNSCKPVFVCEYDYSGMPP